MRCGSVMLCLSSLKQRRFLSHVSLLPHLLILHLHATHSHATNLRLGFPVEHGLSVTVKYKNSLIEAISVRKIKWKTETEKEEEEEEKHKRSKDYILLITLHSLVTR
jgi:hypothetical protein